MIGSTAWVVGSGGLLGSRVREALALRGASLASPSPSPFSWSRPERLPEEFAAAARSFAGLLPDPPGRWLVLWCAGAGTVASPEPAMERETSQFAAFLEALGPALGSRPGTFFFASSAGALYAGCASFPVTEEVEPAPLSPYGHAKRRQEDLLRAWAAGRPSVSSFVARLTNLYGPGQNPAKAQGLISYLSRCLLHHRPAHVYSPLDTLRDHLHASDAAALVVAGVERLARASSAAHVTKIVASGETATIAMILGIFRRLARHHPRIVCSESRSAALQPRRLVFRSGVWPDLVLDRPTPLPEGIHGVHQAHLRLLQEGRLPPPPPARP